MTRRRVAAVVAALVLPVLAAPAAFAATGVTIKNPGGLVAVGPVNTENGFPAWYEDSRGLRLEPCLDAANPLCGLLPGEVPDETQPISFPDNFPEEFFYFLAGAELDLPGGGSAVLTTGLEAAFANVVQAGDQVTFGRVRIVVKDGAPDSTYTFDHPYGSMTIDTDDSGRGRLVEDIAPSVGNFTVALRGNVGPFLEWTEGAPAGYVGDPAVAHQVKNGPLRNTFVASGGGLTAPVSTDQFTIHGKIATNKGVTVDSAVINGDFVDVFATSGGSQLEVPAQGALAATPMLHDPGSDRFYARVALNGSSPTSVRVRNISDNPVSSSEVTVTRPSGITITQATYDGVGLTVAASAQAPAAYPLEVPGLGVLESAGPAIFPVLAPPATITVRSGTNTATAPVVVSGGSASPEALPPVVAGPDVPPVCEIVEGQPIPCGPGGVPADAPATAIATAGTAGALRGAVVTLDGSTSVNSTTYAWTQVSGPAVTFSDPAIARPTITIPVAAATTDTAPRPTQTPGPVVVRLTTTNAGGPASTADVTITVPQDTLTVGTARHRIGNEIRINGTSLITGVTGALTPATTVVVYTRTNAAAQWTKLGTSPVDTTGAWSVRVRPGPNTQQTQYQVQSSRGGVIAQGVWATR